MTSIRAVLIASLLSLAAFAQSAKDIAIPYEKFTLKNGLTVLVHEDHKAPIVAVNVWYHVGSKNEKKGKTGFAHLFEHLMFNGSENYNDDYFQALERVGATDLNGTTNNDRTNYFQNVPVSALDLVLFLESDRMGHLLGAIDTAKLNEQRGVVQNEKRQGENQPYAIAYDLITQNTFPAGHPYSWTVIGSMEDLNAASLDDVHEWFKSYYGAANATLVIAGDVKVAEIKDKVEKYFGDIPPGPPVTRPQQWIAKMSGTKRMTAQDRVPQSRLFLTWNVPQWGTKEITYLDLLSDLLTDGKTSRLYKRLVYDEQIATQVSAYVDPMEIAGQFQITATVKPGGDLAKVEAAINDELARLIKDGPTAKELERLKAKFFANFIRGIERIGGFGGKSDILAENQVFGGNANHFKKKLEWVEAATVADLKKAAADWLSDGVFALEIHPYPKLEPVASTVDRKVLPEPGVTPDARFPEFKKATLSNGLQIVLAKRSAIPVVSFRLMLDAGYASDQFAVPGTASMAMNMLDEGTKSRDALAISEELNMLGTSLNTASGLDMSYVALNTLKSKLDKSLEIFADVILNPSFPQKELDRLKKERIAQIQREKMNPVQMGLRVFPGLLFGSGHAYSAPFTGSGYEADILKMTREDMVAFHQKWLKPNNATLVIVGDIDLAEVTPKLEALFKGWGKGEVPKKNIAPVALLPKPVIYIMDKPAAEQSIVFAANVMPAKTDDEVAVESMNNILGGTFTSRINMNLREDKHWSYGSSSILLDAKAQRTFLVYALVQTDKTKESMEEILKELTGYLGANPATAEELDKTKRNQILQLPGIYETADAVSGSLSEMVTYKLPDDYFDKYSDKVKNLSLADINAAAAKAVKPGNLLWVIVGDKTKIEQGIKTLGYDVKYLDADGKVVN